MLGNPERAFPSVQIAGTNGKGTVAVLLAHAARAAGLKCGLFTSPHLHRFSERIQINGVAVGDAQLHPQLERVLDLSDSHPDLALTFFEIATLAALLVFKSERVELAVLEVGLGGRLDATSVADPVGGAITSIGLDHTAILGDTVEAIAAEKAAIARPGTPLVVGALAPAALKAVRDTVRGIGPLVRVLGQDFQIPEALSPPWPGTHQRSNLAVAWALYRHLGDREPRLTERAFAESLVTVSWPGRFERVRADHLYLLDCAHNLEAIRALLDALNESRIRPAFLVFGALRDKPADDMLALLRPAVDRVVLVPPPIDRARDPVTLAKRGDIVCGSVDEGLLWARADAHGLGGILVTGSIFTVARARGLILEECMEPLVGL
jgi:dihydrofolate synthase/folylpolyglutamate synthase